MLKTWYFFLLCLLFLRLETNPGLKVRITQKGLDCGWTIGMKLLKQAVLKETLPSWSGQENCSVVKVYYVISRLRLNAVDFPETSASFFSGTYLSVAQASATISADWRIHTCLLWIYSILSGYLERPIHTKLDKNTAQSYAAASPVLLRLMATSPPEVSLNAGRCVLQITGYVEVFAVLSDSTTQYIFAGNLQKSLVENFLSYALQRIVIPIISGKLGRGFPLLNLAHTSLTGPVIKMNQGHLVICTDVPYQLEDEEDLHSHC